ncbi:hypothetical protein C8F04DRAFT_966932 [Mycena alexandri]|uniref:Protein kinase domain-containing protein n=1 Tax=Mycena alexandri TaxID=1745969 RepID=A0AAD6SFA5_9AGAR|nr:hypothetical protein C8F04DRAFT_966932 [Mycena alexandri]
MYSPPSNPRQRFIGTLRTKAISPSQFALPSNYKAATDSTEKLRTHPATDRPLTAQPDVPNTLLCGIFRRFLDNVQSSCPLPEDYDLAIAMRACMSEIYAHESMLRDAMNKIFMARFQESMAPHAILGRYEVDGLQWLSKIMVALAEYKKDASGGSEPQFQSVHYYSTATINEAEKDLQRRLPLLLMTCVGSVLTFSGGVWNSEKPVVQKLFEATASFDWDMSNDEAMEKAARLMRAYSIAITEISVYKDPAHSADFPDVTSWDDPQHGGQHQFRYVERVPGHLLFRATDESNQRLLVKFTKRYSPELHHFCAQKGFAPELKAVVDIGGRWRMVVMADVSEAYHSVGESQEFSSIVTHPCLEQFKRAVQGMHNAGFVHGDIRLPNILVHKTDVNKPLLLVDFDWGGLANEVRYPGALNPVIQRHSGARSGLCITTDHDTFMLEQL